MKCLSRVIEALAPFPEQRSIVARVVEQLANEEKQKRRIRDEIAKDR
jgi:hypothetical protein